MLYLKILSHSFLNSFSDKFETSLYCDSVGNTTVQSSFQTVIKDDVPSGETWSVEPVGASNRFSYSTTRAGTTSTIKWVSYTQVVSIAWS